MEFSFEVLDTFDSYGMPTGRPFAPRLFVILLVVLYAPSGRREILRATGGPGTPKLT